MNGCGEFHRFLAGHGDECSRRSAPPNVSRSPLSHPESSSSCAGSPFDVAIRSERLWSKTVCREANYMAGSKVSVAGLPSARMRPSTAMGLSVEADVGR